MTLPVFADIARFGAGSDHTQDIGHMTAQSGLIKHMVEGHTLDTYMGITNMDRAHLLHLLVRLSRIYATLIVLNC